MIIITKSEIIELIWNKNNKTYTKKDIKYIINSFVEEIQNGIRNDKKVKIGGLGTFSTYSKNVYIETAFAAGEVTIVLIVKCICFKTCNQLRACITAI